MSDIILKTEELGISFGGLKAAQNVNIEIHKKQLYGLVGPNGAGKTTIFNMLTGVYQPTTGKFYLDGEDLTGMGQEVINHKGISYFLCYLLYHFFNLPVRFFIKIY